jgi:Holliday junction resolvase
MIKQNDPVKRGRGARRRGANAERELAALIRDTWGYDVHRGYTFHHESDLVGLDGIHPEVKRVEKLNIHKAMSQAIVEAEKRKDGQPTVFFRRDRGEWLVCIRLPLFMEMYEKWRKTNGK